MSASEDLIVMREGAAGLRPALAGTRLDVWQLVETVRQHHGSPEAAADYLEIPVASLRAALRYYDQNRVEVDTWIERARAIAEQQEALWQGERSG